MSNIKSLVDTLKELGLRQADVARELGVTPGHLLRMASGERKATPRYLSDLKALIESRAYHVRNVLGRDAERESRIEALARKRDYAADVLGKPFLALTYQQEIDGILSAPVSEPKP